MQQEHQLSTSVISTYATSGIADGVGLRKVPTGARAAARVVLVHSVGSRLVLGGASFVELDIASQDRGLFRHLGKGDLQQAAC